MGKKKKDIVISIVIVIVSVLICCFIVFINPAIYDYQCKTRVYKELEDSITESVLHANINIVTNTTTKSGSMVSSYNLGASGVIFERKGNHYYALTASHVVSEKNSGEFIIIPYGSPTYTEYSANSKTHISLSEYYGQFAKAEVIYTDKTFDLAVIHFTSDRELAVLPIAEKNPDYQERIAVISNPDGEKFAKTYGEIKSKGLVEFWTSDGLPSNMVLQHSAYEAPGSSGGVVLNNSMEIVGVNIGGSTNFLGKFLSGAMIPSEQIQQFLSESNLKE